jgi:ribonucleoside-diphosphate reductase alpha chain
MSAQLQEQLHLRGMEPLPGKKIYVRKRDWRSEESNKARPCLESKGTPAAQSPPGANPAPLAAPPLDKTEVSPAGSAPSLLREIYSQALPTAARGKELEAVHRGHFSAYIHEGHYLKRLARELPAFDLEMLAAALRLERDELFPAAGLQALYDDYLLRDGGRRIETPQYFWMRAAMGLALNEGNQCNARALEFYDALSTFRFVPAEPVLRHAGTIEPRLVACFAATSWSDLEHVSAHHEPGRKGGLTCSWLEPWHIGIWDFLQRAPPGDPAWDHDLNKALWVPDLFMKRVRQQGRWTLFGPDEVPDLHQQYGRAFEKRYLQYEQKADRGEMRHFQRIHAADLWREILDSLAQTGQPWLGFKDAANVRSTQDHAGVVHCASPCTSVLLNTSPLEASVCSLGSINLAAHLAGDPAVTLDLPLVRATVRAAMRMLDNAIDISSYPGAAARAASREHRPAALGILGFQDALDRLKAGYASAAAADFADRSMEIIAHCAILASASLARERGPYPAFAGSKWSHGLLPVDTLALLAAERGMALDLDLSMTQDWELVREAVRRDGLRHCTTTGISSTEAGSRITGVSPSIEPAGPEKKGNEGAAFEIGAQWLIECAARRQKWLDLSQTLTLYAADVDLAALAEICMRGWEKGLKTMRQLHSPPSLPGGAPQTAAALQTGQRREPIASPRPVRADRAGAAAG